MNGHYKKLLLTSALILISLNVDAFSNPDSEASDENPRAPITKSLPKNTTDGKIFYEEGFAKEEDNLPASLSSLALNTLQNAEDPVVEDLDSRSASNLGVAESSSWSAEIPQNNLFVPASLGKISVSYQDNEFYVSRGEKKFQVMRHNLSKELQGIPEDKLKAFLNVGYLSVKQQEDDNFKLIANLRLRGGGIVADNTGTGRNGTRVAEGIGGTVGAAGGAWLGSWIGGAIGSIFGPGGTATGAWIGSVIGTAFGAGAGTAAGQSNPPRGR